MLKKLKPLGVNQLMLDNILKLAKNNPDKASMLGEGRHETPVSMAVAKASRHPKKFYKLFLKMGMYNLVTAAKIPTHYSFVCKLFNGQILERDLPKSDYPDLKQALAEALVTLAEEIRVIRETYEAEQKAMSAKLQNANIKINGNANLTPELVQSITEMVKKIESGEVELTANVSPETDIQQLTEHPIEASLVPVEESLIDPTALVGEPIETVIKPQPEVDRVIDPAINLETFSANQVIPTEAALSAEASL